MSEHHYKFYCWKCKYVTDHEGGAQYHSEIKCHFVSSLKPQVERPPGEKRIGSKWLNSKDGS